MYVFDSLYCTTKAQSTDIWFVAMASNVEEETVPSVDEQAFDPEQPPTYDAAFPALSSEARSDRPLLNSGAWQPKFQTRASKCTQVIEVQKWKLVRVCVLKLAPLASALYDKQFC